MSVVGHGPVKESEVAFIGALIELMLEQHLHHLLSKLPVMFQGSIHCLAYSLQTSRFYDATVLAVDCIP